MATKKTLTPIKDREKKLVSIKDRYPKKSELTDIKDKYPKVDKNKLSTIRDKSSTGVNKDALKPIKNKKKSNGTTKTVTGTGVNKLKNKMYY